MNGPLSHTGLDPLTDGLEPTLLSTLFQLTREEDRALFAYSNPNKDVRVLHGRANPVYMFEHGDGASERQTKFTEQAGI